MRLLLVRRSAIWNNLENRFTGQTHTGLGVVGFYQARAMGERLSRKPLEISVASHLGRTRFTAQTIRLFVTMHFPCRRQSLEA